MRGKFIVYSLVVMLICTVMSWSKLLVPGQGGYGGGGGSSWSSSSGSTGGSWSGGWHK